VKCALFIAEKPIPGGAPSAMSNWSNFQGSAAGSMQTLSGIQRLSEGVYLCSLDDGLTPLTILDSLATKWHIPSRTLFFESDPPFVVNPGA
jgi:hypothetical protein